MIDTVALREKVLDLAICGKLVPQDPNDEPASVLLERIRTQKQQMVKDGKLKAKDIKDDSIIFVGEDNLHYEKFADGTVECIEDKIPFELPDGWLWTRLGSISSAIQYGLSNSAEQIGTQRLLRITDIQDGKVNWDTVPFTTVQDPEPYLLMKGDIVFARTGATVGKSFLIEETPYPAVYASYLIRIRLLEGVLPEYIYQFFNSQCYWNQITDKSVGVGQPNCNGTSLKELFIPLPPANEQSKLVPSSRSAIEFVIDIENQKNYLLEDISTIKSKILDLAIRGKLVPQNPDDEPASVLLERIRAEKEELISQGKIKRDKKESVIFKGEDNSYYVSADGIKQKIEDYMQYSLPEGWVWICLKDVATISSGKTPTSELLSENGKIPYYKISDMNVEGNELFLDKTTNYLNDEYDGVVFNKGSFVFPKNGGAVLTNKKRILLHNSLVDLNTGVITFSPFIDAEYAFLMFSFIDFSKLYKGSTIPTVDANVISNLIFALPPLNEQQHIVQVVKKTFAQLDAIADSLN